MEFKNSNRLSNKELLVLKDQKQLSELKTQIEKDTELKNRFVDHYLKYMERSRNEQSKKYVTDIFFKAIKALSILSPDQDKSLTTENLKETLISLKNPSTSKQEAEKKQVITSGGSGDSKEDVTGKKVQVTAQQIPKVISTSGATNTKVELPSGVEVSSLMKSRNMDITKPLSIGSTIDFNGFLRQAYDGIQKVKEISTAVKNQNIDIDELLKQIDQIDNNTIEKGLSGGAKIITDIAKVFPGTMGQELGKNLPNTIQSIKADPNKFKELKQTIIAGITLCKNGFIDTVCDELLSGGMRLYSSLPTITPANVNNPESQEQFMKAALKIAQLLKSSLLKGYNVAKNSTIPHNREVMSQLQTEFVWKLDQIPDNINFDDPKMKEDLKKGYYGIVNFVDKTGLFANKISGGRSFTISNNGFSIESNLIATNIAEQQLQIFNKCKSLKFGLFSKKKYETTNPDGSIFRVAKEKKGYHISYENAPQLSTITFDQQGNIVDYISLKKDIINNTRSDSPLGQDPTHDQKSLKLLLDGCNNIR